MSIPPTPTSIRSSSTRSSLYDRYASPNTTAIPRHHYYSPPPPTEIDQHELARVRSCLAQKEAENATMKQAVSEWQAKVQSYRETQEQLQGKIRCLHAEMEAMKKAHVERVDHDAQLILDLSREIEQLKSTTTSTNGQEKTSTEDPCVTAEETYKKAASQVLYGRKKADALILGINDMVRAIEEELACLETQQDDDDDNDGSDTMSSRSSPDTRDQQHTMDNISNTSAQNIISSDDSNVVSLLKQSLSPVPVESSSTTMVAESDISHKSSPSSPSSNHHHQQQQRSFRPRSQTMDTLVKKASMFLLRPNKRSTAEHPQQHDSYQPQPTPSCTSPHPGSSYQISSTGPVSPTKQHRDKPFSSRRSSIQNLDITTTVTTSTPLYVNHKDKRRQSMLVLPSVASQHQPLGSMDNMTWDQSLSSSSSRSRLMYHYQQQQHAVQEYYQRRRRSAIVGGATPPFMGGGGELKSTTSEQWKISNNSSRR